MRNFDFCYVLFELLPTELILSPDMDFDTPFAENNEFVNEQIRKYE